MKIQQTFQGLGLAQAAAVILLIAGLPASAQTYSVVHSFTGSDGAYPQAALIHDSAGNLYGTTNGGGNTSCYSGCGTIFKIDSAGNLTTLYRFQGTSDGYEPYESLLRDGAGNLYGATTEGGTGTCGGNTACGTFYKLNPAGSLTLIHTFNGNPDGATPPPGRLATDGHGNLYGTTGYGGPLNGGTIYKLSAKGKETILYSFGNEPDGDTPMAGLVLDLPGRALYGTTEFGGNCPYGSVFGFGCGTVYKLSSAGETQLYVFTGQQDGASPNQNLVADSAGNLYDTTEEGGDVSCPLGGALAPRPSALRLLQQPAMPQPPPGCGTVFKLNPKTGAETVLYSFTAGADGAFPIAGVVLDSAGNIYGSTPDGGDLNCNPPYGCGTIFKLSPTGKFTVLHTFTGSEGASPGWGSLLLDRGNLYGTTGSGGTDNNGVIFKITP